MVIANKPTKTGNSYFVVEKKAADDSLDLQDNLLDGMPNIRASSGHKSYSQAANPIKTFGNDSQTNGLTRRQLNSRIDCAKSNIIINKFPGADTKQLLHYFGLIGV